MPTLIDAPSILQRVETLIGRALADAEAMYDRELASCNPYIADILSHTRRFRGKRLRPLLLLLAAEAAGGIRDEHAVLAAVVEMIHTATLVHDDVLDEADLRRHVATVNARWNNSTSVLFGDYLFTHAFHLAATVDARACRLIGRATNVVCEGELTQVRQGGNLDLSEAEYLQIVEAKTGELCAIAGRLGGCYAGANDEACEALDHFGRRLGIAFQIADDVLDLTGTEQGTGKSLGSDLRQRKLTLPLIRMLASDRTGLARELMTSESVSRADDLDVILRASGALDSARATAERYAASAAECLQVLPASEARTLLREMAAFAVRRDH
jgi:octaprenyl-diphosphate synthase